MKVSYLFLAVSLVGGSLGKQAYISKRDNTTLPIPEEKEDKLEAKRFIVEFEEGIDPQEGARLLSSKLGTKILKVFDDEIFHGASVETAWQSTKIQLSDPQEVQGFSEGTAARNYSNHHMTGVDKVHAAGILGKGAVVAVVDSGIDYNHPALGGGFGPGFKIAGGYDLVGDGDWGYEGEPKQPDDDPMEYLLAHGTHVTGIIAGKSDFFTGVAPEATILFYKVFAGAMSTDEETLIDAFLMAYKDGADIITCSIGSQNGWTNGAWAVVASRLVEKGLVITISAGNDGAYGAYTAGSGSSAHNVIAVASVTPDVTVSGGFYATFNLDGESNKTLVTYYPSYASWWQRQVPTLPFFALNLNTDIQNEACSPLPEDTPDLSNKIIVVRRGGCPFSQKQNNLRPFGAKHVMVYNNGDPMVTPISLVRDPDLGLIETHVGAAIINTIKAGGSVIGNFSESAFVGVPASGLRSVASDFTSVGPTNELFIKPDIAAPGSNIYSTWPGGWFNPMGGTSQACPYVAGVAALYISKHGGRKIHGPKFGKDLTMRIISSGESILGSDGQSTKYGAWASVAQVGTGLVNASKLINYDTSLSFAKFHLNDTLHFSRYHKVQITNTGTKPITYTWDLEDAGGFDTYAIDSSKYEYTPRVALGEEIQYNPQKIVPKVSFPGGTWTLQPGQTRQAQFNFMYPSGLNPKTMALYSGKVLIKGSNGEILGIPYLGLGADLHKDLGNMFKRPEGAPIMTSTNDDIPISVKSNFTFDLSLDAQDFPWAYISMNYATPELRWDIFESRWGERHWKYPPVQGENYFLGSAAVWAKGRFKPSFDPAKDDENDLLPLPFVNLKRTPYFRYGVDLWWLGKFTNGTKIPPGKYRMRLAALVPFGKPQNADNWDVFQTPEFEVLPLKK